MKINSKTKLTKNAILGVGLVATALTSGLVLTNLKNNLQQNKSSPISKTFSSVNLANFPFKDKHPSPTLLNEINKVIEIRLKTKSVLRKQKPSSVTEQMINENQINLIQNDGYYMLPTGLNISYMIMESFHSDHEGILPIVATISDGVDYASKIFWLGGFGNDINKIELSSASFKIKEGILKSEISASQLADNLQENSKDFWISINDEAFPKIDFNKYHLIYSNIKSDDKVGKINFSATVVLSSNKSVNITFDNLELTGFQLQEVLLNRELDKMSNLLLTNKHLENKFPHQVTQDDLNDKNLIIKNDDQNYSLPHGYQLSYMPVANKNDDLNGTLQVEVTLTRNEFTKTKLLTLSNLSKFKKEDFALELNNKQALNSSFASEFASSTFDKQQFLITSKPNSNFEFQKLQQHYDYSYEIKSWNDKEGTIKLDIVLTNKNNSKITKKFQNVNFKGFKKEIDLIQRSNLAAEVVNTFDKTKFLASELFDYENWKLELEKLIFILKEKVEKVSFVDYIATNKRAWVNDIEGKIAFKLQLSYLQNISIFKIFDEEIEISGFKKFDINKIAIKNIKLKTGSFSTLEQIKLKIDNAQTMAQKLEIFKHHFSYSLPKGAEISNLVMEKKTPNSATFVYKLTQKNINNGSKDKPNKTVTLETNSQIAEVTGFKTQEDLLNLELAKITKLVISNDDLLNKYPYQVTTSDLNSNNLSTKNNKEAFVLQNGYDLKYETIETTANNLEGTLDIVVTLTKDGVSKNKTITLSGLKSLEKKDLKIQYVDLIEMKTIFPTTLQKNLDIDASKLKIILKNDIKFEYSKFAELYNVSYENPTFYNGKGKIIVDIVLRNKKDNKISKTFKWVEFKGFKREIDLIQRPNLTADVVSKADKANHLASELFDYSQWKVLDENLIFIMKNKVDNVNFNDYIESHQRTWVNDIEGKIAFKLQLSYLQDISVFKVFDQEFEISGFKKYNINDQKMSNIKFKEKQNHLTITKFKQLLENAATKEQKLEIFNQYFTYTLPKGTSLEAISITEKTENVATFNYKLTNRNINSGTKTEPTKTVSLESELNNIEISGFITQIESLDLELAKITKLEVVDASILNKFPHEIAQSYLTSTNLKLKNNQKDYSLPEGYSVSFSSFAGSFDDLNGNIQVDVILEKDQITKIKTLTLSGFKKITKEKLQIEYSDLENAKSIFPTELKIDEFLNETKVKVILKDQTYFTSEKLAQLYEISYTDSNFDDKRGQIITNVTLTNKKDNKITKTFKLVKIKDFKKEIDLIEFSALSAKTTDTIDKTQNIASALFDYDKWRVSNDQIIFTLKGDSDGLQLNDYIASHQKAWVNDVEGKIAFKLHLSWKNDLNVFKLYEGEIEVANFKKYNVNEINLSNIEFRPNQNKITIENFATELAKFTTNQQKTQFFGQHFTYSLPLGVDIESLTIVEKEPGIAALNYQLIRKNIDVGSKEDKTKVTNLISDSKIIEIQGFQTEAELLDLELAKITHLEIVNKKTFAKYPYQIATKDIEKDNLIAKNNNANYSLLKNYSLSYSLVKNRANDLDGTSQILVSLTKGEATRTKAFTLSGFKKLTKNDFELKYNGEISQNEILATSLKVNDDIDKSVLRIVLKNNSEFDSSKFYELYFGSSSNPIFDDIEGKINLDLSLTNKINSKAKITFDNFELNGLKKEIDNLVATDLVLDTVTNVDKSNTLVNDLFAESNDTVISEKLLLSTNEKLNTDDYLIDVTKSWVNQLEGKIGFNIKLIARKNNAINKAFENIKLSGLKKFNIDESLLSNISLKTEKSLVFVADFVKEFSKIENEDKKVELFQQYFFYKMPSTNSKIKLLKATQKSSTVVTLSYQIIEPTIADGNKDDKEKNVTIESKVKNIEITGFADQAKLLEEFLSKINQLTFNNSNILNNYPYQIKTTDLTLENLVAKNGDKVISIPENYKLNYALVEHGANDLDGSLKILIVLTQGDLRQTKEFIIKGFKKIEQNNFVFGFKNQIASNLQFASSLLKGNAVDLSKATLSLKKDSSFENSKFDDLYLVSYKLNSIDDKKGEINLDIIITNKNNPKIIKTFEKNVFNNFKKYFNWFNFSI